MKEYAFRIVNVFTREGRLTGNPLAVIEDATGLADATQQALARQFNLSETTFIFPSEKANARVRIYTPAYEMPFAGHPTLGTAHVVRSLEDAGDSLTLEMKAGIIPVEAKGDLWTLQANAPSSRPAGESAADLAQVLGIEADDVASPVLWVSTGREQLVVPLKSAEAVRRVSPRAEPFARLRSEHGAAQVLAFADSGGAVESRFFFPSGAAILEDPATGSACANLGGWFIATGPGRDVERVVSQGEAVGRPSTLHLAVRGGVVFVGGHVIELGRGHISL
ncbi:MAG TPA: PhzF family phenazine biosynthesis protein [Usitatibacter sp.]|jgi:PhzF family phenazine biosynthesis protein|nr:PhzF family phenazine biosynthesis protein [Usitatibacter sp.]